MNKILTWASLILLVTLSGCASMSKKDCQNADWYGVGVQDGRAGRAETQLNSYVASCNKHDISVNQSQYLSGRAKGLETFCLPDNGYQIGLRGRSLPNVCPANLQPAFAKAHERGFTEYKIQRDYDEAEKQMAQLETAIVNSREAVIKATAELYGLTEKDDKTSAQAKLNDANRTLADQQSQLEKAISQYACAGRQWYQTGALDAQAGRSSRTYDAHVGRCQSYHPETNKSHYQQGFSKGLAEYCSYDNGVAVGSRGEDIVKLCTGNAWSDLQRGHKAGLKIYDEKVTVAGLQMRTERLKQQLPSLQNQLKDLDQKLAARDLTSKQKLDLTRQKNRVAFDLSQAEVSFQDSSDELNCYVANWEEVGFEAGERGAVFDNRSKECRRYGISVDERQFEQGYNLGLQRYCTEANGQAMGALGQVYNDVCPRSSEASFLKGYRPAFAEYQRTVLKAEISKELELASAEYESVTLEIDVLSVELDRDGITRAEKLALINEISALTKREQTLADDLEKLNSHRQCLTDDWRALGYEHAASGQTNQLRNMACQRFSVQSDDQAYREGYARGLGEWCTQAKGYELGLSGKQVQTGCSRNSHREFFNGVAAGAAQGKINAEIDKLKLEKLEILERAPILTAELAAVEQALLAPNLSTKEQRQLNQKKLNLQQEELQAEGRLAEIDERLLQLEN